MEFLLTDFLGKPLWMWCAFLAVVSALLAFDLGVLHRRKHEIGVRESLTLSAFYITAGLAYGGWVWWAMGDDAGLDYLTGFVVEKSLALDNVFVIATIFGYFAIPREYQHRVLFWGILGVIVLRGLMIGLGAALVTRFDWVLLLFAAFLIFTGIRMLVRTRGEYAVGSHPVLAFARRKLRVTEGFEGGRFLVRRADPVTGRHALHATPLFLALVLIELADVVFAVDSVPAIFAITTDPFIVYTSNIFAVLGLRALYFAVAAAIHRFRYLKYALAAVLVFIGAKVFVAEALGMEKFPPLWSLGATLGILAAGIGYSLYRTRREAEPAAA